MHTAAAFNKLLSINKRIHVDRRNVCHFHFPISQIWPLTRPGLQQTLSSCCVVPMRSKSFVKCNYELGIAASKHGQSVGEDAEPQFQPRRAVILTKMTRYEYEKKICQHMSDTQFREYLDSKGSDYKRLLERHKNHYSALEVIKRELVRANIETHVVHKSSLNHSVLDRADVVFTAGGDGTYLLAANKFLNTNKPLIGINTEPDRSEGNLCLPKRDYCAFKFGSALTRLLAGDFAWKLKQRIQVTMSGRHANDDPVELYNQQMISPGSRFTKRVAEGEQSCQKHVPKLHPPTRRLPCLALNEVFMGESQSSRVSYYEITTDTTSKEKQKSSGVIVCTGTGSSSWHFHMNRLSMSSVEKILNIANQMSGGNFPVDDPGFREQVMTSFNDSLRFDPGDLRMAYTIRDPIRNAVFNVERTGGFAQKIVVRSRMWDACLVVDGGMSFQFNDGAVATFEIAENNALCTVTFD